MVRPRRAWEVAFYTNSTRTFEIVVEMHLRSRILVIQLDIPQECRGQLERNPAVFRRVRTISILRDSKMKEQENNQQVWEVSLVLAVLVVVSKYNRKRH
jgi:hypothetical protein